MGLLTSSQNAYYNGNDFGNYQFTSLEDIINQFEVAYVGDNKIIPQIKRADIQFHAMRALRELSFDTFKSVKTQQIDVPASLTMVLPHDYVNYTRIMWSDGSGIKHPIYPTRDTQNPFQIKQEDDGSYFFGEESERLVNFDFSSSIDPVSNWTVPYSSGNPKSSAWSGFRLSTSTPGKYYMNNITDSIGITSNSLSFSHLWITGFGSSGQGRAYGAWQRVDTSLSSVMELRASASSGAQQTNASGVLICDYGVIRVGVTSKNPAIGFLQPNVGLVNANATVPTHSTNPSPNFNSQDHMDLGYVEWDDGTSSQKELLQIDVSNQTEVWVWITSYSPWNSNARTILTSGVANGGTTPPAPTTSVNNTPQTNSIDQVSVIIPGDVQTLSMENADGNSSTWNKYKANTPSENRIDDYEDDTYWPYAGQRYGLEPSHAQVNGSFYIDQRLGKIHFSSNISGKTVILDYISDSLGTDAEMQVHKFAEEAMYKWMAHAILSTSSYGQPLVRRLTKEKFAAIRQAKLRLSNIKIEEITQILRGKSKQIKH